MSSGQIAQRPYSSFRARYDFNSPSTALSSTHRTFDDRMFSYTSAVAATASKAKLQPLRPILSSANSRKAADNNYVVTSKSITPKVSRKVIDHNLATAATAATVVSQGYNSKTFTTNAAVAAGWNNKAFYASTRSTPSNNNNNFNNKQTTNNPSMETNNINGSNNGRSIRNRCIAHTSKSPISSGASVESIVPKYGTTSGLYANGYQKNIFLGSQKRAYNPNSSGHNTLKENVPTRNCNKKTNAIVSSISLTPKLAVRKLSTMTTLSAQENYTASAAESSSTSSNIAFSSKFPNGLPFEEEFYQFRDTRSHSTRSNMSKYSSYSLNNYESSSRLPFEDEFTRKPSNEALYVDFSKSIPVPTGRTTTTTLATASTGGAAATMSLRTNQSNSINDKNNNNCFYKFESGKKSAPVRYGGVEVNDVNLCRGGEVDRDHPVVYVAVASWIPKCNQPPTEAQLICRSTGSIKESTAKGFLYVLNLCFLV